MIGDIIPQGSIVHQLAIPGMVGPREAMGKALAAYLLTLVFRVYGGGGAEPRDCEFSLRKVLDEWPGPEVQLEYPCASIIEAANTEHLAHSLTPTPLEETWGTFDLRVGFQGSPKRTVLWKEGEASAEFQIDFWTNIKTQRQSIEAVLPFAFSPGEGRSGVIIAGPELYYDQNCRFTLINTRYDDSGLTAYRNEWRLRTLILGEIDIVSLRMASETTTPNINIVVDDPNDPSEEDES